MGTVGCVLRTHRLIGVIGNHALQDRNRTKCVYINTLDIGILLFGFTAL
jgi:hypothetical protein